MIRTLTAFKTAGPTCYCRSIPARLSVVIQRLSPLRSGWNRIREVSSSNTGRERGYPSVTFRWVSSGPLDNFPIVPRLSHECFRPNLFQFITYLSRYHSTLCNLKWLQLLNHLKTESFLNNIWKCSRTSQETRCVSATKIGLLMLFRERDAVRCENHTVHRSTCTVWEESTIVRW
jgi:hypothetical protein